MLSWAACSQVAQFFPSLIVVPPLQRRDVQRNGFVAAGGVALVQSHILFGADDPQGVIQGRHGAEPVRVMNVVAPHLQETADAEAALGVGGEGFPDDHLQLRGGSGGGGVQVFVDFLLGGVDFGAGGDGFGDGDDELEAAVVAEELDVPFFAPLS